MSGPELTPCHANSFRSVDVYVMDEHDRLNLIGKALYCGKDGWVDGQRVECWKVYGVRKIKGVPWPEDLTALQLRDLIDGQRPIYRDEYGYFLERSGLGLWELVGPASKRQPALSAPKAEPKPSPAASDPGFTPDPDEEAFE